MADLSDEWKPGPLAPSLTARDVHLWRLPLVLPASRLEEYTQSLSADEKERSSRFRFQKDRDRFRAARGSLREILSRYLSTEPNQLRFIYSSYGKPALSQEFQGTGLHFNLSHAGEMGLLAVALRSPVGVDIEFVRNDLAGEGIARRFFSPREVTSLLALPLDQRTKAFFTCWTRKEALIKAVGEGLSIPLDSFDVSFLPGEPVALTGTRADPLEAGRWLLHHIEPGNGYIGAAAIRRPVDRWVHWE